MKKRNAILTLGLIAVMMFSVHASAASVATVNLNPADKSAQSGYELFSPSSMYCEVTSASKYPIKFQAYGKNDLSKSGTSYYSVTYNVNASGTKTVKSPNNYQSIKLTGWNIDSEVKGCIGVGKIN